MPQVKMLTSMAGANWSVAPGETMEVNEEVAQAWVEAGLAELVEEPKKKKKGE